MSEIFYKNTYVTRISFISYDQWSYRFLYSMASDYIEFTNIYRYSAISRCVIQGFEMTSAL